jgi:hypothetical protein
VVGAIEAQRAILADRSQPIQARRDALKFIVHFIGDAHQPMHAGSRTDSGGNGFQVSLRTPIEPEAYARSKYVDGVMGTNLHSVWDYYILAGRGLGLQAYSDKLDALPWPPTPAPSAHDVMPLAWAGESCRLIEACAASIRRKTGTRWTAPTSTRCARWPSSACARPRGGLRNC